jgi:hypothetical protein
LGHNTFDVPWQLNYLLVVPIITLIIIITKNVFCFITCNCTMKENCTQVNLVMLSPIHCHASCHTFHHVKACIILLRVVHVSEKVRVDQVLEKVHPSVELVPSLTSVILLWNVTFFAMQESPCAYNPFLLYKYLLHFKSCEMCIK